MENDRGVVEGMRELLRINMTSEEIPWQERVNETWPEDINDEPRSEDKLKPIVLYKKDG